MSARLPVARTCLFLSLTRKLITSFNGLNAKFVTADLCKIDTTFMIPKSLRLSIN